MINQLRCPAFWFLFMLAPVWTQAAQIDDRARAWVMDTWQLDESNYEIEILSSAVQIDSLSGHSLSFKPLTQGEPLGLYTLLAEVKSGDKLIVRGQIRTRVRRFEEILVARDKIRRHEILTNTTFELKRVETTSLREQPVREIGDDPQCRSTRNLSRGQILTFRSIELVPDIEVGREVSIIISGHLFAISASGRAMQDGLIGELVKVKNLSSGKIVRGKIIDRRTVRIEL